MENLDIKQKLKYILPTAIIFFFIGILFDQYILNHFFNFKECTEEEKTETQINLEVEESNITVEEKKLVRDTNTPCTTFVDVSGALKEPGVYCMQKGALIIDVVNRAGGFTSEIAYRFVSRKINLAQKVIENQKIYFPFENEMECKMLSFLPEAEKVEIVVNNSTGDMGTDDNESSNSDKCININTASLEQLDSLTGVGPSTAQKIIEGRPYQKTEDILNISGIGESSFTKFKEDICI